MKPSDGPALRRAADVLEQWSKRPGSFVLNLVCRFLRSVADDIDADVAASCSNLASAQQEYEDANVALADAQYRYVEARRGPEGR